MDEDVEVRVGRKTTRRIVPFVMLLYFIAFLDRVNVGFAAITMDKDIGLSPAVFGLGAGVFFVGYFLFEVPSNLILHKVGARIWIARVMVSWGLVSAATAFVRGPTGFYILRFLLGVAEAGFFPGVILYLTYWFPARKRAGVTALFMAAAPISAAIGSPISGALLEFDGLFGFHGWQWMFFVEAAPALLLGFAVLHVLTDRPEQATWLDEDERKWLTQAIAVERAAAASTAADHTPFRVLLNPGVLILSLIYFGASAGLYTLGIWSPQIIRQFGLSPIEIGVVNALPATVATFAMIFWARHSDRTGERNRHVLIPCLVAAVGFVLTGTAQNLVIVVAALTLANIGISAAKPPLWSIPTLFLSGSSAAAGIAAINSIGNLGGFVGPAIIGWLKGATGSFQPGLYSVSGALVVSACLVAWLGRSRGPNEQPHFNS